MYCWVSIRVLLVPHLMEANNLIQRLHVDVKQETTEPCRIPHNQGQGWDFPLPTNTVWNLPLRKISTIQGGPVLTSTVYNTTDSIPVSSIVDCQEVK